MAPGPDWTSDQQELDPQSASVRHEASTWAACSLFSAPPARALVLARPQFAPFQTLLECHRNLPLSGEAWRPGLRLRPFVFLAFGPLAASPCHAQRSAMEATAPAHAHHPRMF